MEEAPKNGKELLLSARANGMKHLPVLCKYLTWMGMASPSFK